MIEIRIPQLGEGLQEARIVRFLKRPGEAVAQDEPIYEMETDKAVMEIESPSAGVIESWTAKEDDILPIGAVIGSINPDGMASPSQATDAENEDEGAPKRPTPNTQRPTPNTQRPTPNP